MELRVLALVIIIVMTTVSAWIVAFRMRRRMRRALKGRTITDVQLTSIATWMDVDQAEKQEHGYLSSDGSEKIRFRSLRSDDE